MNRYRFVKQLGDGTYGSVILATTLETEEKVAIKRMKKKFYSWEECLNLREVKSLRKLNHANIVKLKEVIRENDMLYFVFEYMKENLYQMTKDRNDKIKRGEDKLFPESTVRNVMYQVLQGLAFMHKHGFFHRDLKPENLLCSGPELVKIADFGLAREIRSRPPYTDYVSTRWYRAPEILLRSTSYSSPIDIWAVGCIMAEVYTLRPLFPGSSEIDQLFKITSVLGTPSKAEWPEGHKLAAAMNFKWPQMVATPLKQLIPNASADGLDFMRLTMLWDPQKRPSCAAALKHNFFKVGQSLTTKAASPRHTRPMASANPPPSIDQPPYKPSVNPSSLEQSSYKPSYPAPVKALPQQTENIPPNPVPSLAQQPKAKPQIKKDPFSTEPKKSGHRRRWNMGNTEDWEDDLDLSFSIKKKPPLQPKANFGNANKPLHQHAQTKDDDFEDILASSYKKPAPLAHHHQPKPVIKPYKDSDSDDDDWFAQKFGGGAGKTMLPKITNNRINSGRSSASSAKQVYMSKSRYMPGKNPLGSARKDSGTKWSSQKRKQEGLGGMNINRTNAPLGKSTFSNSNTGGYVPSFGGSANKSNFNTGGWKRAEPAPVGLQKPSATRQPVGATGRTDWASKYLK